MKFFTSDVNTSIIVLGLFLNLKWDGVTPVVVNGVFLYLIKNRDTNKELFLPLPASINIFFRLCFTVLTPHSAQPFELGWYGGEFKYVMPLFPQNCLNSIELNGGPLSATNVFGNPKYAKITRNSIITFPAVVDFIALTSNQRVKVSTTNKKVSFFQWKKSIWILSNKQFVFSHFERPVGLGELCCNWQGLQHFAKDPSDK